MIRTCVLAALFATTSAIAAAQTPEVALLEKRVPEELASEGIVLSRQNLALQLEPANDQLLISLVDMTTGRVAASTKLEHVPPDREAAVAVITHVAAGLVDEIAGRRPPPSEPAPAPVAEPAPPVVGLIDDRAERAKHELAELRFKRRSIRFSAEYQLAAYQVGNVTSVGLMRNWVAYQGDLDEQLEPERLYEVLGRPDLVQSYKTRENVKIGMYIAAGIVTGVGLIVIKTAPICGDSSCDASFQDHLSGGVALSIVGLTAFGVGLYLHYHPHPVSEDEVKSMADDYNQNLRTQLGLPVAARTPRIRDLQIAPFASGSDLGFAVGARF